LLSIAFQTTNKALLVFILACCFISCSPKTDDYASQCQGWNDQLADQLALSNAIYKILKQHSFNRHIAIKTGSDRGFYQFSFLGQSAEYGLLIRSDGSNLTTSRLTLAQIKSAFSILPENIKSLQSYSDDSDPLSHLSCGYMRIKTPEQSRELSFYNYTFKYTTGESATHSGVATLARLENHIKDILLDSKISPTTIKINDIPQPDKTEMNALSREINIDPVFYEIP